MPVRAGESDQLRGGTAVAIAADVSDSASLRDAAEMIAAELGAVDVLVNNAGVMLRGEITHQPMSEWQRMIDTNLLGALHATRAFLPALIDAAASLRRRACASATSNPG
jgi:NADP-dependent 3-hydroxy acid dehydrogenase YdfG